MKKIVILTALALGAAGSLAFAGTAAAHRGAQGAMLERLKAADTNADGLISRTEAAAYAMLHLPRTEPVVPTSEAAAPR